MSDPRNQHILIVEDDPKLGALLERLSHAEDAAAADLHARVAQGSGDDLCASVVTVQTGLRDDDLERDGVGFR